MRSDCKLLCTTIVCYYFENRMWYLLANVFFTFQILNVLWRVFSLNQAILWNEFEIINTLKCLKTTSSLKYFKIYQLNKYKYQRFYCLESSPLSPWWNSPTLKIVLPPVSEHWFDIISFCFGIMNYQWVWEMIIICNHSRESLVEFESTYVNPHLRLGVT